MSSTTSDSTLIVPEVNQQSQVNAIATEMALIVLDDKEQSQATINVVETENPSTILSLPTEIHLKIFKYLDRASSTCFGLTSRKFYPIHKGLRGFVPLTACCLQYPSRASGRILFGLLREWMEEAGLKFSKSELKFITPERKLQIKGYDVWWSMAGHAHPSPMQLKLVEARASRHLEMLKDEKEAGGWWEKGVWINGVESGRGVLRWIELASEGIKWEGGEKAVMHDTSWW